jgi:outer membrane immunogenic protein
MKKLLLASSALVFAGPVFAADLPARPMPMKAAPVVAPIPYTWTGCYVGGHAGAGWDRTRFEDPGNLNGGFNTRLLAPTGSSITVNGDAGFLGGVQAGCDYQFAGGWVIGIGGDFAWSDIHGTANDPFFNGKNGNPITLTTKTDRIASVTGRIGYAWDRVLFYGKGGGAWAHDKYSILNSSCGFFGSACGTIAGGVDRTGWTAGAGIEWAFADNWSAFAEYDHYAFGNKTVGFSNATIAPVVFNFNVKQDIDLVKVGVNYRFNFGGPVVARY